MTCVVFALGRNKVIRPVPMTIGIQRMIDLPTRRISGLACHVIDTTMLIRQCKSRWGPLQIRRYPFVLAERNNGQDFSVCIDTAFPGWEAPDGEPLFDDQGAETPLLKNVLGFLGQYQGNIRQTQAFTGKLNELNVLVGREIRARDTKNQPLALRGFYAVDEAKLNALSDGQIAELYRAGFLGLIHAHLISLGNVVKLEQRLRDRE